MLHAASQHLAECVDRTSAGDVKSVWPFKDFDVNSGGAAADSEVMIELIASNAQKMPKTAFSAGFWSARSFGDTGLVEQKLRWGFILTGVKRDQSRKLRRQTEGGGGNAVLYFFGRYPEKAARPAPSMTHVTP